MIQAIFIIFTPKCEKPKVIINLKKLVNKEHDLWLNPPFPYPKKEYIY